MGERGVPPFLTYDQVRACHALYMQGLSLREVARRVHPHTRYASVKACANGIWQQFVLLGLPRRDRKAAIVKANQARGFGMTRRELRVRRGETLDRPPCAGVRTQYPRKGAACRLPAARGSIYCRHHDPAKAEDRAAGLAAARDRLVRS